MRITRKDVEGLFVNWCKAHGFKVAGHSKDVGAYNLDYDAINGGFQVYRISSDRGTEAAPFGDERHKLSEMWHMLRFSLRTWEENNRNK
jgi:hypothetical protein